MGVRPQAFLSASPLESINNCTVFFPPLCFVSSLVLGNIWWGGNLVIQLTMFPGICKVYYLFWKHKSFIRVILGHLLSPHFSFRTQCAFFNFLWVPSSFTKHLQTESIGTGNWNEIYIFVSLVNLLITEVLCFLLCPDSILHKGFLLSD